VHGITDRWEDDLDAYYRAELQKIKGKRFFVRKEKYRKREDRWKLLLHDDEYLNDTEFLSHFRVSRSAFRKLVALIRDDPVYQSAPHRTFRGEADLHLLILLKFLGTYGNDNTSPKLALFFGLGSGSTGNYLARATEALLKIEESTITWPDEAERRSISQRIQVQYTFPNCVGMVDGTLLPLEQKPQTNGEDYYTRKGGYALNALITCDDVARIRDVVVGWPGSVHDNRVWSNTAIHQDPAAHFDQKQYLLGDSAFQASSVMIPAFKKPPKAALDPHKSYFNTKLAKPRVKTEHSIGLIKARFQYFKCIRAQLKTRENMQVIIRYFICTCILHNLLIAEPVPADWREDIRKLIRENRREKRLGKNDELNVAVPQNAKGDERRKQLLAYMLELRG
jgi:hypothetical protein